MLTLFYKMPKRLECKIYGRVQGVFFRDFVKTEADKLGLFGFVRNEPNGGVLVVAEGDETKLQEFLATLLHGNEYSKIEKIDVAWEKTSGEFSSFEIKY